MIGVGGIAQTVTEKVEGEDRDDDVGDWEHQPRIKRYDINILRFVEQNTPACHWWPQPEPKEGKCSLAKYHARDHQCCGGN